MEPSVLVLLAIASVASAGPITLLDSADKCASECSPSSKYNFVPGMTYMYNYKVDTVTSMSGASEDSARLSLSAKAEIEVVSSCDMVLTLKDIRLLHSDVNGRLQNAEGEDWIRRRVQSSPLRFSLQNGIVNHVCPESSHEPWILNIQKGLLSALQNSMDDVTKSQNLTETDVTGHCKTEYVSDSGYYTTTVSKAKDILSCQDRHDYQTIIQMVPYTVPSEIQSLPIMKTTHKCQQDIKNGGVLQSAICTESHVYRPFSNGQSGASTNVEQKLVYDNYRRGVSSQHGEIQQRDSLVYDHTANKHQAKKSRQNTEKKLKEICENMKDDIRPNSARLFSNLVSDVQGLDKDDIKGVLEKLKRKSLCPNNNKAQKTFYDALPAAGTSASVSTMVSLINQGEVKDIDAKQWIMSLAFIQTPTSDMLMDVKTLLDSNKLGDDVLLPVSSLVNNFCNKRSNCNESYPVTYIIASLERNLGYRCDATGQDFYKILRTLKAIGNAGHSSKAVPSINKCLSAESNPLEIRVAAADAFRRLPCNVDDNTLWETLNNTQLDSELRIQSYLAIVRCPNKDVISRIVETLDNEEDTQVGSFIYSHLVNLKESADPHKQDAARTLDSFNIPNKFESSPLKASANVEASALLNKINTGFVAESNLVWSNNNQMPRSMSANLTVELFGQSINLMDVGARLEGIDYLLKQMIGAPMGGTDWGNQQDVSGSVYGRMFGNELFFLHSGELKMDKTLAKQYMDIIQNLAKKQEISFTHNSQFIDTKMTIPTVAGLPINLNVNGSVVVDLLLSGKADIRRVFTKDMQLEIDGEIRPSAALELTGTMSVDAITATSGLRMRNTLHTSTSVKSRIQVDAGELLSVEFDSPQDQMEIFDARSKFFILHNGVEQEQKMISNNRKDFSQCSSDKLAKITGAVLCGQLSYINASMQVDGPYFPLTGPSSASLVLRKTDIHSGYKLFAKRDVNKKTNNLQVSFNTPGSRVNRVILMDMTMDVPAQTVDVQLITPWKKAAFEGSMANKDDLKSMSGKLTIDDSDVYKVLSEVKISKSQRKIHLTPTMEISKPGMKDIQLNGYIAVEASLKTIDVDVSVHGLQKLPYQLKSSVSLTRREKSLKASISNDGDKTRYSAEAVSRTMFYDRKIDVFHTSNALKISSPKNELVNVEANADYKEGNSLKVVGSLDIDKIMKKPASFKLNIANSKRNNGGRIDVDASVTSTIVRCKLDSYINYKGSKFLACKTNIDYNIPGVAKDKVVIIGKYNDKSTDVYTKYNIKSKLDMKRNPEYNFGVDFGFDHKKKHSEAELEIKYGPDFKDDNKRVTLGYTLNRRIPNYSNAFFNYKIKAEAPQHNVDVEIKGKHEHDHKSIDSDVEITAGNDQFVKAYLTLKDKSNKQTKINGRASVAWPGAEYTLHSKLDQKSPKHFTHELHIQDKDGNKHSIESVYKKSNSHVFSTEMNLKGLKKMLVSGSANLQSKTPHAEAEVKYGQERYGISTKVKPSKNAGGTIVLEMVKPERRVVVKLAGEKDDKKCEGSIETAWDADNDKSQRFVLDGKVFNKNVRNTASLGAEVSFSSPFENLEKLEASVNYGSDRAQRDISGKLQWGLGRNNKANGNIVLLKPVSVNHLVGSAKINTPFRIIRDASVKIEHTLEKQLKTVVKGSINRENAELTIEGRGQLDDLKLMASLTSTIENAEDVSVSIEHRVTSNSVRSEAAAHHNNKMKALVYLKCEQGDGKTTFDFELKSPLSEDLKGQLHVSHGEYTLTSDAFIQWHPRKRITMETSVSADNWERAVLDMEITTPVRGYRRFNLNASNKKEGNEVVSQAKLEYGSRKNILIEARHSGNDENKLVRLRMSTPFDSVQSLDAGLSFNGRLNSFDSKVDLEIVPLLGKYQASANWQHNDDLSGSVRVETPIADYSNMELSINSREQHDQSRKSRVELKLNPATLYSLDTQYCLDPIFLEATVNSPHPDFDNVGVVVKHFQSSSKIESHTELRYKTDKAIQGNVFASWDSDVQARITLETPFEKYEKSKLVFSHQGPANSLSSHGEIHVAEKSFVADASFKSGYETSGSLTLSSPVPGMENVNVIIMKRGRANNLKASITLDVNDQKVDADYQHKVSKEGLKANLKLQTPYTENLRIKIEHNGQLKKFTNEISANYGRNYKLDSDMSFEQNHPEMTCQCTIKYKVGGRRNIARVNFDKNVQLDDMTIKAKAAVNDDEISVDGSFKTNNGLEGNVLVNTPFEGFETTGISISHVGPINDFRTNAEVTFMDSKKINGKISFYSNGIKHINLDSELTTPFKKFPSANLNVNHNYDQSANIINGDITLTTPVADFGTGTIKYDKVGDARNHIVSTVVKKNGRQMGSIKLSSTIDVKDVQSKLESSLIGYPDLTVTLDHAQDHHIFNTKASASLGDNKLFGEISKSGNADDLSVAGTAGYNDDTVRITGTLNRKNGVEGSVEIHTPFDNFNNVGMRITHNCDKVTSKSSAYLEYMDGQKISGSLNVNTKNGLRLTSELKTPFPGYENTLVEVDSNHNSPNEDIDTKITLTSTIKELGNGEAVLRQSGNLDNLVVVGSILRNNIEVANIEIRNKRNKKSTNGVFTLRGNKVPDVDASVSMNSDDNMFETKASASVDNTEVYAHDMTLQMNEKKINADAELRYDLYLIGSKQVSMRLEKDGEPENIKINTDLNVNGEEYHMTGKLQLKSDKEGILEIKTPIDGYKKIGVSFIHKENTKGFVTEGKVNLMDGDDYSFTVDLYNNGIQETRANAEILTPIKELALTKFTYNHEGQDNHLKGLASLEYGNSQKISCDISAALKPNVDLDIVVKTPYNKYKDLVISASAENNWPKLSVSGKVNAGNSRNFVVDGSLDARKGITGHLTLSTPFEKFSKMGLSFDHVCELKNFNSKASVMYMKDKEISGKIDFKLQQPKLSVEIKTPFAGYENTEYEFSASSTDSESKVLSKLVYGDDKVWSGESVVSFSPKPGFAVIVISPVEDYENLKAAASIETTWPKLELKSEISSNMNNKISLEASFDASNDVSGLIQIITPIKDYTNVGMNFQHSGSIGRFDCQGQLTFKDGHDVIGKLSVYKYMMRRLGANLELSTPFKGVENVKTGLTYEDNANSLNVAASFEGDDEQKMDGNLKVVYSPNYEVILNMNTPFKNHNQIRAQASLDLTSPTYNIGYSFKNGEKNVHSANGKLNVNSAKNIDGSLEIVSSFKGMEFTKVEYEHSVSLKRVDGSMTLTYGKGKTISGELKASKNPNYDVTIGLRTPFKGYENIEGSINYDASYGKYEASSSLSMGSDNDISVHYVLDTIAEPIRAQAQIRTPYDNYRNLEFSMTKEGKLDDFHISGLISSPITEKINVDANVKYNSLSDLEAQASMKTTIEGFDDLVVEIKNTQVAGERKSRSVVGWASGKQVVLESNFHKQNGWYEDKIIGDLSLTTPFSPVRSISAKLEHTENSARISQTVNLALNGDKILDMDSEYSYGDKHEATLTFREPKSMKYTLLANSNDGLTELDVNANWDRNNIDSNARVLVSVQDKKDSYKQERHVDISLQRASSKVGLVHDDNLSGDSKRQVAGKMYWGSEENSKVYYDFQLETQTRYKIVNDASFVLGFPNRELKLEASTSDNQAVKLASLNFNWDALRSDQQVGIKASHTRGDHKKTKIILTLPGITQEIRLDGEHVNGNSHCIIDSKTDISFSQNSLKTLTLTSTLESRTGQDNSYNYSLALGVSHPYTNVDVQMKSHLGNSDEKMTTGISTDYLTARRQNINLGLLAEINKLKKQICLQITNPMKKVEIIGQVKTNNPYRLHMSKKVDDIETFRSDVMLDTNKKMIELQMDEGSEGIKDKVGYPNSKTFVVNLSRTIYGREEIEGLLALHLNTTRLLHTRLHWNPELVKQFLHDLKSRIVGDSVKAAQVLHEVNSAVADEIADKYVDIVRYLQDELMPVLDYIDDSVKKTREVIDEIVREISKLERDGNNPFGVVEALEDFLAILQQYHKVQQALSQELRRCMEQMTSYPIRQKYDETVNNMITSAESWLDQLVNGFDACLTKLGEDLAEMLEKITRAKQTAKESLYNATYISSISDRLRDIDVSRFTPSMEMPQQYHTMLRNFNNAINSRISQGLNVPGLPYVSVGANEIYQQGMWAYKYWKAEKNIESRLEEIVEILLEIIKEELKVMISDYNPVKVWDPQNGEIQVEIPLPIDVERLDELPDLSQVSDRITTFAPQPSMTKFFEFGSGSWANNKQTSFWNANETEEDENDEEVRGFFPVSPPRRQWFRRFSG